MPVMPGRSKYWETEAALVEADDEEGVVWVLVVDRGEAEEDEDEEEEEERGRLNWSGVMGNMSRGSARGAWGWK